MHHTCMKIKMTTTCAWPSYWWRKFIDPLFSQDYLPHQWKKRPPLWQDPTATRRQGTAQASGKFRFWTERQKVEVPRNIISKLSQERNLRTFIWNIITYLPRSSRRERLTWIFHYNLWPLSALVEDIPVLQICESSLERHQVCGHREGENFGSPSFPWIGQDWTQTFGFFSLEPHRIWQPIHTKGPLHRKLLLNFGVAGHVSDDPDAMCAKMTFPHHHDIHTFHRMHNVNRIPTGPDATWPNPSEICVRLFKHLLFDTRGYSVQKPGPHHLDTNHFCPVDA